MKRVLLALTLAVASCHHAAPPVVTPPVVVTPPPVIQPPAIVAPVAVRVDGPRFVTGPGTKWDWVMLDGFRDLEILLSGGDLEPQLKETTDLGYTGRRVLLSAVNLFRLVPSEHPDWPDGIARLADLYAAHGIYGEFDILNDYQLWGSGDPQRFVTAARDALGDRVNVFLSLSNEPFKNGVDPSQFSKPRPGPLFSFGSAVDGMGVYGGGDFAEFHTRRDAKWVVTVPQSLFELHAGFGPYPAFGNPIVLNEPMGAAESPRSDRSTDAYGFYQYGVEAALHTVGATFHSDAGLQSQLLGPVQRQCAVAFRAGLTAGAQRP